MSIRAMFVVALAALAVTAGGRALVVADAPTDPPTVKKIWDQGKHNAFTDLLRHGNEWFCVFREGAGHVSPDGALRVLTSKDGSDWTSAALVTMPGVDLRDAKICVTPKGQLMLCGAGVVVVEGARIHQSYVWFSDDGRTWSEATAIGDKHYWIWRITWHKGSAYGVGYNTEPGGGKSVRLYKSDDGKKFETLVADMGATGFVNEASLLFNDDGTALCVLRRDVTGEHKQASALLGTASAPYTKWEWHDLGVQIGGPQIVRLENGDLVVSGRSYPGGAKTKLWKLDAAAHALKEAATFPSGGDTSYPGLVQQGDQLWVSYYSSHEGKTSIYLGRLKLAK